MKKKKSSVSDIPISTNAHFEIALNLKITWEEVRQKSVGRITPVESQRVCTSTSRVMRFNGRGRGFQRAEQGNKEAW